MVLNKDRQGFMMKSPDGLLFQFRIDTESVPFDDKSPEHLSLAKFCFNYSLFKNRVILRVLLLSQRWHDPQPVRPVLLKPRPSLYPYPFRW